MSFILFRFFRLSHRKRKLSFKGKLKENVLLDKGKRNLLALVQTSLDLLKIISRSKV